MSIPFTGSKSVDDRRRRRLVVHSDESILNGAALEEGALAGGVASELVASEAAGPWVPVQEWRIWTYGSIVCLVLLGSAFALVRPIAFRPELAPLTGHLLQSPRPVLGVLIQTLFWFLSAQLAILIGWYRSQCKLDFRGRYRIWPWAATAFALASASSATNAHQLFGLVIARGNLLSWRADVVSWLLPASVISLPLVLLLDRDVRRSRSSLFTLRAAWVLGLGSACLELLAADLKGQAWFEPARTIVPMFGTAVLFLGLWLHARIVAYVCPDPPESEEITAVAQLLAGWSWMVGCVLRWRPKFATGTNEEESAKPKRGRKKSSGDDEEDAAPKRKRRAPAKRTTRTRSRSKVVEEEQDEEQLDESNENAYSGESYESSDGYDESDDESNSSDNDPEWDEDDAPPVKRSNPQPSAASSARKPLPESRSSNEDSSESSDEDEDGDDAVFRRDSGMSAEQMKGLSKRQKRDLRRQLREQQRNQRR